MLGCLHPVLKYLGSIFLFLLQLVVKADNERMVIIQVTIYVPTMNVLAWIEFLAPDSGLVQNLRHFRSY